MSEMSKIHLTYDRAEALLDLAVAAKGSDHVCPTAPDCEYFSDGAPACIVGHVLHFAGVEAFAVGDLRNYLTFRSLLAQDNPPVTADAAAASLLGWAQRFQDNGKHWGDAVEQAKERTAEEAQ